MATPELARNRTNVRFEKIVGTKLESSAHSRREFIDGSDGYDARKFANVLHGPLEGSGSSSDVFEVIQKSQN
jgi:hypothetical protein